MVRVRFAPSPTGYLHVGGLRTALYNFLFARKHHGTFVLRIEDTDRSRYVPGAVDSIIDSLSWSGIEYDEGPRKGGPFGPYVQSERLSTYAKHAEDLIERGYAYRCFCTAEKLERMRKQQEQESLTPKYDRTCLRLTSEVIETNVSTGIPFVIRMKIPGGTAIRFRDLVRDVVEFESAGIDDQVLIKSDGYPTYHMANVVDDHLMGITHVIRGEEWLSSTPKHVLLYEYFGWKLPTFAHLPLLLNPDRSKLSKRQGDVSVEDYRSKGYLPEALTNFVALLGWNPGDEREIFDIEDLISEFSIDRVGKSGAIFNLEKLQWLNFQHLRRKSEADVLHLLKEHLSTSRFRDTRYADEYLLRVIRAMRERVTFMKDYTEKSPYFFERPTSYDPEVVKKRWKPNSSIHLQTLAKEISAGHVSRGPEYEEVLNSTANSLGVSNAQLIHAVRLAVSGVGIGPGLYELLEILGPEESVRRIEAATRKLGALN